MPDEIVHTEFNQETSQIERHDDHCIQTEELIKKINNRINATNDDFSNKYNCILDEISKIKSELSKYIDEKFSTIKDNLDTSIENKFIKELNDLNVENNRINSELCSKFENLTSSLKNNIDSSLNQAIQKISSEMNLKNVELDNHTKEVKSTITSFINTQSTNIESVLQQFEDKFTNHQDERLNEFSNLKTQISSLLPQASAVGISKAYADAKNAHESSMRWYRKAYIFTVICMLLLPVAAYYSGFITDFFELNNKEIGIQKFIFSAIRLAALELPLLWIANLMAKKIQQHQRIHEEYVHKYTAAMTFVGMSKEAKENTKIFGEDHIKKLTEGFRDAVYMNPSKTLDREVKADSPLEMVSSLVKDVGSEAVKTMVDNTKK